MQYRYGDNSNNSRICKLRKFCSTSSDIFGLEFSF